MNINYALILVILTVITGIITLIDIFYWSKRRNYAKPNKFIKETRSFFTLFLFVLLLRSFLVEPFRIPSGSLEPTLLVGDFVAVNKFAYGLRLPAIDTKIIPIANPKIGQIAVFRWPPNPKYNYIKRVIGTPGDKITYRDKKLTINGVEMKQTFINYTIDASSGKSVAKYRENLNGIEHDIYIRPQVAANDFDIIVPPHSYFMMGDNRDDSADSRFWGYVGDQYLRGKAFLVWLSWDHNTSGFRWYKIGQLIT